MSATDIEKRNAADKADWSKRGVSGVVASKSGSEITLKIRTMGGEQQGVAVQPAGIRRESVQAFEDRFGHVTPSRLRRTSTPAV